MIADGAEPAAAEGAADQSEAQRRDARRGAGGDRLDPRGVLPGIQGVGAAVLFSSVACVVAADLRIFYFSYSDRCLCRGPSAAVMINYLTMLRAQLADGQVRRTPLYAVSLLPDCYLCATCRCLSRTGSGCVSIAASSRSPTPGIWSSCSSWAGRRTSTR